MAGSQAILRIAAHGDQPEQIVLTAAGMIALLGINSVGVACCVNTLRMLRAGSTGMPVAFIIRQLLRNRDALSAGRYLMSVPHASGQHYALADRHGLRGYECSADGCKPGPDDGSLLHTNHPLWWTGPAADQDMPYLKTTHSRLRALEAGLEQVRMSGNVEMLLSSTASGLCVRPSLDTRSATFCSAEFTLTSPPLVRVALGRPNEVPWQPVTWTSGTNLTQR
jgi:hypothetical protein